MKNIKSPRIITLMALVVFAFFGCGNDTGNHSHKWEWVLTQEGSVTEERMETETCSCGETGNTRSVPIEREKIITLAISHEGYYDSCTATVKGILTLADLNTFSEQIKTATDTGFGNLNAFYRIPFVNVFGYDQVIITIENNVDYESYEADNKFSLRFNFNYLISVSTENLITKITTAVTEMNGLPIP